MMFRASQSCIEQHVRFEVGTPSKFHECGLVLTAWGLGVPIHSGRKPWNYVTQH